MQYADQINDRVDLRDQAIQCGIVMNIGFDHLYGGQDQQRTGTRQTARGYDDMMTCSSKSRDDVRADEATTPNN